MTLLLPRAFWMRRMAGLLLVGGFALNLALAQSAPINPLPPPRAASNPRIIRAGTLNSSPIAGCS